MAASKPATETDVCNIALNRIGEKSITVAQFAANSEPTPKLCNLHYAQTRDSLLRSHWWWFAKARAELEATDAVGFEWSNAFALPDDFLRLKSVFEDNATVHKNTVYSYELEESTLLTNESSCSLRYIKQVTDVQEFDPLFLEVFTLQLAIKLVYPLAGVGSGGQKLANELKAELYGRGGLMSRVRALTKKEGDSIGRADRVLWNASRSSNMGRIDSRLGGP